MARINMKQLEKVVWLLNDIAGTPQEQYTRGKDGKLTPNANCYHLSGAYGGWQLNQMCQGGGTRNVLHAGHQSKRVTYDLIHAYMSALRDMRDNRINPQ